MARECLLEPFSLCVGASVFVLKKLNFVKTCKAKLQERFLFCLDAWSKTSRRIFISSWKVWRGVQLGNMGLLCMGGMAVGMRSNDQLIFKGYHKKKTEEASFSGFPYLALFTKNKVPSNIFYCSYYVVVYEIKSYSPKALLSSRFLRNSSKLASACSEPNSLAFKKQASALSSSPFKRW